MPKSSFKSNLLASICELAEFEMLCSSNVTQELITFDEAVEDLLTVSCYRYSVVRQPLPKSLQWYANILPTLDDFRFKHFMRVTRYDFGRILSFIELSSVFSSPNMQKQFSVDRQLAITLFKFGFDGTGSSISTVAGMFGVGDGGTIMKIVNRVIKAILHIEKDWISWPGEEERQQIETLMADKLPKCMGFMDGSHINLDEAPTDDPESYFTRKQRYAIQIQATCDMERRIRNIAIGYPGSVHDARVYGNSELGKSPNMFLSNGQWIAGDSAYGVSQYVLTPYRNNAVTGTIRQRVNFNKYFASFRVKIECCFGILKETFASLKGLRIRINRANGHKLACEWTMACCILYNMILESLEDFDLSVLDIEGTENDDGAQLPLDMQDGEEKRIALLQFVTGALGL